VLIVRMAVTARAVVVRGAVPAEAEPVEGLG